MSNTIDSKVVEMRFDNRHFESNVSTTMSTLDKLKQKLNLTKASKSLEDVGHAAKKVDLSGLSTGAETVGLKFNAMYTIADQALRNITNSAMAAGKRIVSALTIDPVRTGFQEYETQINAVQTILANTQSKGTTIDDVNKALDELNAYADKTIYNFTEMTRNIGTFTAAGVDLDTSVKAIQGIANLAAVSGSTSQQASTAMYQLSQALSSGTVKLMDWNSVVNAGMGGQVFQDALKETARVHGVAIDEMIESQGSFRETLSEGWLTSEILTDTLEKFTLCAEEGTEEWNKYMEALKSKGYTEEQAREILKLGNTATEAATKVKTFTQLWDVLKEAAQSGWTQTWEIIIGDYEEAKNLLSPLADFLTGIVNKFSEFRNAILESAFAKGFTSLKEKLATIFDPAKKALDTAQGAIDKIAGITRTLEEHKAVVDEVINGDWGHVWDRWNKLTDEGYDWVYVQNLVNEELGCSLRRTSEYTKWLEGQSNAQEKVTESDNKYLAQLVGMTDAQLKALGLTKEQIEALRELEAAANKLGMPVDEFLSKIDEIDGRWLFIESFKNIGKSLMGVAKAFSAAWEAIFNPKGLSADQKMERYSNGLFDMLAAFYKFTRSLQLVDQETGKLNENGQKLQRTFKGIFAILDIVTSIVGGGFKIAFKVISQVLSYFKLNILDVTANVADAIVAFHDWLFSLVDIHAILDVVVPWIKKAANWIGELCKEIAESEAFAEFKENVSEAAEALKELLSSVSNSGAVQKFASVIGNAAHALWEWIKGMQNIPGVRSFLAFIGNASEAIADWIAGIKDADDVTKYIVKGIVTGLLSMVNALWDVLVGIGGYLIDGISEGIIGKSGSIWKTILNIGKYIVEAITEYFGIQSPSTLMMTIGGFIISGLVIGLQNGMGGLWTTIQNMCSGIVEFVSGLDFGTVLAGVLTGGIVIATVKVADAIQNFSQAFGGFGDMLEEVGDMCKAFGQGVKNYLNAKAVLSLSIAIAVMVGSLIALALLMSNSKTSGAVWESIGVLAVLTAMVAALAGVIVLLNSVASKNKDDGGGVGNLVGPLLAIAGVMLALAIVLKLVSTVDPKAAKESLKNIALLILEFISLTVAIGSLSKMGLLNSKVLDSIGAMLLKMGAALLLAVFAIKMAGGLDRGVVTRGLGVVTAIGLLFAAVIAVSKFAGQHASSAGGMLLKMSIAMGIMVAVVKLAAGLERQEINKGLGFVAMVELLFIAIIAVSKLAGENASKAGGMLVKMAIAIGIMLAAIKLAANIDGTELAHALGVIAAVGLIFAALIAVTNFAGENTSEVGSMLIKMSVALLILSGVIFILSLLSPEGLTKALTAIAILTACFAALIVATGEMSDAKGLTKSLIMMTIAIGILGALVIGMSFIDPKRIATATAAMSMLIGMFSLFALAIKRIDGIKMPLKPIITMLVVVGLLVGALFVLDRLNIDASVEKVSGMAMLLNALASALYIISHAKGMTMKDIGKALVAMAGLSAVLALLGLVLAMMNSLKVSNAIPNATALSILIVILAGVATVLALIGKKWVNIVSGSLGLAALAGVLALLGLVLAMMDAFNIQNALSSILSLSALLIVITGIASVLAIIGKQWVNIVAGSLGLAALAGVLALLGLVLAMMDAFNIQNAMPNVLALLTLLIVMTGVFAVLSLLGPYAAGAMAGIGAMALLGLVVAEAAIVLGLMSWLNIEPTIEQVAGLSLLLLAMSGVLAILSWIGPMASAAYPAMAALAALLGGLVVALGILGGLSKIPGFNELIADGGVVLGLIGQAIGAFVGGIVGGIAAGVALGLPLIGECLSAFMTSAEGFITGVKNIDSTVLAGAGYLSGAILAFAVADVIAVAMTLGGLGLVDLGLSLSAFMESADGFLKGAAELDPAMLEGVKTLAGAILTLAGAGVLEAITSFITGGSSIEKFGEQLPILAKGLADFKTALGENGFTEADCITVQNTANAIKALAEAASTIPNSGGWLGAIVGENDLGVFADQFPKLGEGLAKFRDALGESGLTEEDLNVIKLAANAVKILAGAASEIPNSGGWLGAIVGENDLDTFAAKFPLLAAGLIGFKARLGEDGLTKNDLNAVEAAASAVKTLATVAQDIPNSGGWVAAIVGDNDLGTFASSFPSIGTGLAGFRTNLGEWTEDDTTMLACAADGISVLARVANTINDNTSLWDAMTDDFTTFVNKLPSIGTNLSNFSKNLGNGFNLDTASILVSSANALETFAGINVGEDAGANIVTLSSKLPSISSNIKLFSTNMKTVSTEDVIHASSVVVRLKTIVSNLAGMNAMTAFTTAKTCRNISVQLSDTCNKFAAMNVAGIETGDKAIKDLVAMVEGLVDIDTSGVKVLSDALKKLVDDSVVSFAKAFTSADAISKATSGIKAFVDKAAKSVENKASTLKSAFSDLADDAASALTTISKYNKFKSAGSYLVDGFAAGISANTYKAKAKASAMASAAEAAARKELGIHSPSKVFYKIGDYAGTGFINALHDYASESYKASSEMAASARNGLKTAIGRMYDAVSTDIDAQPTIRPVLDLSDVEAGANRISGMFSMGGSVGVLANVGAISTMMDRRSQNGGNSDIVSAIDKLRGDMANRTGDTYQINGITYDDGSNIKEAIKVIVREAKVQRRR